MIRLKRNKIKINAGLSAICNKLNLIPTKVIEEFKRISEKSTNDKFMVRLQIVASGFEVQLVQEPDICYLKSIKEATNRDQLMYQYAQKTLNKSTAKSTESRLKELKGIIKSINNWE